MKKTIVIYENYDPNRENITHVAIQAMTNPPYVSATYSVTHLADLPMSRSDLPIIPIKAARALFDFKPGKIEKR